MFERYPPQDIIDPSGKEWHFPTVSAAVVEQVECESGYRMVRLDNRDSRPQMISRSDGRSLVWHVENHLKHVVLPTVRNCHAIYAFHRAVLQLFTFVRCESCGYFTYISGGRTLCYECGDPQDGRVRHHVYFVLGESSGLVKIGTSKRPATRFQHLVAAGGQSLRILCVIAVNPLVEQTAHRDLSAYHVGGEWFRDCKEVRDYIDAVRIKYRHRALRMPRRVELASVRNQSVKPAEAAQ